MPTRRKPSPPPASNIDDDREPRDLPSGDSGGMERARDAYHEQGEAPGRKGAKRDRDEISTGDPKPKSRT